MQLVGADTSTPSMPRVLVVDDEKAIRDILSDFLTMEGYEVETAEDGSAALTTMEHHRFDLVLSDLKMPKMGGLELLEEIRKHHAEALTVIMTGFGTVESAITAMKRGAFDYVLKPFKVEDVMQVVSRGVEQQRLRFENMQLKEALHHYKLAEALGGIASLEEILNMICDLTFKETQADAVSLVLEDPTRPGSYLLDRVRTRRDDLDPQFLRPAVHELVMTFLGGKTVLLHGPQNPFVPNIGPHELQSFMSVPLKVRDVPIGVLSAYTYRKGTRFQEGQRKTLTVLASRAAQSIDNYRLFGNLQDSFRQTIQGLAHALEAKDAYTAGHSDRVTAYAQVMTDGLKLSPEQSELIKQSGLMHDIGKIGIRNEDLNKPDKLTAKEYTMFKSHPSFGKHILEPISFLHNIIPGVYYHHEMYDGSGYPEGRKGEEIPLMARILSLADTYDAMCSDRAYRKALPHAIACEELARCAGRQFDPKLTKVFLENVESLRERWRKEGKWVPE